MLNWISLISFYDILFFLGTPSSRGVEVVERKTPQEVLHEQNDQMCQEVEKVRRNIKDSKMYEYIYA